MEKFFFSLACKFYRNGVIYVSVYAWADLHGRFDLLMEGLQYINPEDKVYFLGDAADRGPAGWECIKYILNDERFTYLKGNHEDLLVKAIGRITSETFDNDVFHWNSDIDIWYWNGGEITHDAILADTISIKEKTNIIQKLKKLPFCAVYTNINGLKILLSHAGCTSFEIANHWEEHNFLWDRTHLMFYDTWEGKDNEFIVHGHTPIESMIKEQEKNAIWHYQFPQLWAGKGAYWYGQGHKVNIDTGAAWNGNSVLLNLDTFEEIIIDINSKN